MNGEKQVIERIIEIEKTLARMEEKIDGLGMLLDKLNGSMRDHELRLRSLEKDRNKLLGLGVSSLTAAIITFLKSIFKL